MEVFEANKKILLLPEAKKIIKNYNQLSAVLIEYEVLYHRTWIRQVEIVVSGIHASLIVKHPETNEYMVNFDPEIMTLIRETECMKRLGLDVPKEAENLVSRQEAFKLNCDRIKVKFLFLYLLILVSTLFVFCWLNKLNLKKPYFKKSIIIKNTSL